MSESKGVDKDEVLAAVKQDGHALEYADAKLQNDEEFMLVAVKQKRKQLFRARKVSRSVAKLSGSVTRSQSSVPKWTKDQQTLLVAVKKSYGRPLKDADPELRKDREIVLAAVKQNGQALEYADPELKKDREIVLVAVKED